MASTGLIDIALKAGANPASTPSILRITTAPIAVQKPIWKCDVTIPSVVLAISANCKITTAKKIPLIPATEVSTILSLMICPRILFWSSTDSTSNSYFNGTFTHSHHHNI